MSEVKWIKITTDIFDDEKVVMIESLPSADSIIVIWFKLLTLAGKQNNDGVFIMNNRIAYTDEMLAAIFRRDISIVRLALTTFENFGMIEIVNGVYTIPNWNKHQTLDTYEKKKARDRLYKQERREKQRAIAEKSSDSRRTVVGQSSDSRRTVAKKSSPVVVSEEDKDKDIDIDKDIYINTYLDKDNTYINNNTDLYRVVPESENETINSVADESAPAQKSKKFVVPSVEEVRTYCDERGNGIDAEYFVDFYTANGWTQGKGKSLKDWKAAVRTWERRESKQNSEDNAMDAFDQVIGGALRGE